MPPPRDPSRISLPHFFGGTGLEVFSFAGLPLARIRSANALPASNVLLPPAIVCTSARALDGLEVQGAEWCR
ncbi:MAG: hypothetical protein ACK41U_03295 [Paracoccus sp. (in: a-proteobacteria)]|uniref:hypothetical protein n=1 Tax=Paracoccus sp. TaxID=267 RepID=UPI00391A8311